ncbi:unnamed protein product [Cylindrotheca closterium]|uniref:glutathione-specific gamma-glutamylcyclotransferase n=1 Tax=Cylindrotheca closterium TaxID=2856 RepID=A0AAD2FKF1_9STRA|nr:unnamed protein product [Cylindrotheca closterium]
MTLESQEPLSDAPVWDPIQQIYIGGKLPENDEVRELLESGDGSLRLFGYGSLCWNPGTGPLAHPGVVSKLGRAKGYKRCWAQRSTDHRGNPQFPGIVCTLLEDQEVVDIRKTAMKDVTPPEAPTLTEGVIYWIPPELVAECLDELDFREKGGYARETISVIEDDSGETQKALLYRGTPDSPAFWNRILLDLPHAAAIMAVSEGPSGKNDFYLNSLDEFLTNTHTIEAANDDTTTLASMVRHFQKHSSLHFLYGSGSNQHNQLLLDRPNNAACLIDGEDAHETKEFVLCTAKQTKPDLPENVYAGGGHSGLLTESGKLYLWGWNDNEQCGPKTESEEHQDEASPLACTPPLHGLVVQDAALGFSHTLVIEKDTNRLYGFGSNERGQISGSPSAPVKEPVTPDFLKNVKVKSVAAGLFHSAVITDKGELITFGCGRFGQSLSNMQNDGQVSVGKWIPEDGSPLVDVGCGRRHTVAVDEKGRIWTFGENKYGQLGRPFEGTKDPRPTEIDFSDLDIAFGSDVRLDCGWSHNIVQVTSQDSDIIVYGWGRNDKGQLGTGSFEDSVKKPIQLFQDKRLSFVACGSESTMVLDEDTSAILGCGWNEHGNIATGSQEDQARLVKTKGSKVYGPPGLHDGKVILAVGGGHHIATMKPLRSR